MSDTDHNQSAIDSLVDDAIEGAGAGGVRSVSKTPATGSPDDWPDDAELGDQVVVDIDALKAERDAYLADSQRLAADFANYRKQSEKRVADSAAVQSAALVRDLLPVLDACDSALEQDAAAGVGPIRTALLGELEKNGLELMRPEVGAFFDPEQHDAVQHEPAPAPVPDSDDGDDSDLDPDSEGDDTPGLAVAELLRAGYAWKGRVIRPAMVKVVG